MGIRGASHEYPKFKYFSVTVFEYYDTVEKLFFPGKTIGNEMHRPTSKVFNTHFFKKNHILKWCELSYLLVQVVYVFLQRYVWLHVSLVAVGGATGGVEGAGGGTVVVQGAEGRENSVFCAKLSIGTIKIFVLTWLWHANRPAFQDCKREKRVWHFFSYMLLLCEKSECVLLPLQLAAADNNTCPVCQCIAQGRKNSAYVFANGFLIFNLPFLLRSGQVLLFMARDMQCVATYRRENVVSFFIFFSFFIIFCGNVEKVL